MPDNSGEAPEIEALIHPGDDGKFWAEVVGVPGCYTQGDNYSKILARLRDAHELCSNSPSQAGDPSTPISLDDGATVADLNAALDAAGWSRTTVASETHTILQHAVSGARLCVPRDESELLNSGFRQAIAKYLT